MTDAQDESVDVKRDSKNKLSISPTHPSKMKIFKQSQSKPTSPKNKFFGFKNIFKLPKGNDERRERAKQGKSRDPKDKTFKNLPLQSNIDKPQGLNTTRNSRQNSQKDLLKEGDKNYEEMKKKLINNPKKQSKTHKKTLSFDVGGMTLGLGNKKDEYEEESPLFKQEPKSADIMPQNVEQPGSQPQDQIVTMDSNITAIFNIGGDIQQQDRASDQADKYITDNFRRMGDQPRKRGVNTKVDTITTDPIRRSLEFLKVIINFWLMKKNRHLIYKDQYKIYIGSEKDQEKRKNLLYQISKIQSTFMDIRVSFSEKKESEAPGISDQEYQELAK